MSDQATTSYSGSKARLDKSEKENVEYYVAKRHLSTDVDCFCIKETTIEHRIENLDYRLEGALEKRKKAGTDLGKLCSSVEDNHRHVKLFRRKGRTYRECYENNRKEGFALFIGPVRDAVKVLARKRLLKIRKSVDVNPSVVDEMIQGLETERSYFELDLK